MFVHINERFEVILVSCSIFTLQFKCIHVNCSLLNLNAIKMHLSQPKYARAIQIPILSIELTVCLGLPRNRDAIERSRHFCYLLWLDGIKWRVGELSRLFELALTVDA